MTMTAKEGLWTMFNDGVLNGKEKVYSKDKEMEISCMITGLITSYDLPKIPVEEVINSIIAIVEDEYGKAAFMRGFELGYSVKENGGENA